MAHWHGLAKLRLHTDSTLDVLGGVTTSLGKSLRDFRDKICTKYATVELDRERAARQRHQVANPVTSGRVVLAPAATMSRKSKAFNLNTYKLHALGDYVYTIRSLGSAVSYSSELVRLHTLPRCYF